MTTASASDPPGSASEWISAMEAKRRLAIGDNAFEALRKSGRLTVRQLPGCRPRFLARQVDDLAARSTREAVSA